MDPDFAKSVKEWTTKPEFSSPLVDHLPKSSTVPSPKDILGHHIGAPKKLTYYEDILRYYKALAAKSPRVHIVDIGKTDEGRESIVVFIGSEDTIKNLETYRHYLAQLADPRQLTEAQAREVIGKAKPIYHLMSGLHSGETGPSEMLMELAYRLVTEDSPIVKSIRDHLIVSITPAADPDGRDRYVDWYFRYKINETSEEDSLGGPPYWGKYIFHDDNRDINYSQLPMRNLLHWYLDWHPPIMHDLHESVPFLYTFSGQAPQEPGLDPILYGELPWFANFEMSQLTKYGMPGVWTHGYVDMWSPGYLGLYVVESQWHCCACTKPSAMAERTPCIAAWSIQTRPAVPQWAVAEPTLANGIARFRLMPKSIGPSQQHQLHGNRRPHWPATRIRFSRCSAR